MYSELTSYGLDVINATTKSTFKKIRLPYQKYSEEVISSMIENYYSSGTINFDKYKRFEIKPKYRMDYGDYWKEPYSMY